MTNDIFFFSEFDFFTSESGHLISMRLKKLCESHCEDLALNLVTAYMRCYDWAEVNNFNMNLSKDQIRFFLDVYVALLFKYKRTSAIVSKLRVLEPLEGLELVKRFANKRVEVSKLWRNYQKITQLASVFFCSAAMIQPYEDVRDFLTELLNIWLSTNEREEHLDPLIRSIRKIIQLTTSACHLYIFCEAIFNKVSTKFSQFSIQTTVIFICF